MEEPHNQQQSQTEKKREKSALYVLHVQYTLTVFAMAVLYRTASITIQETSWTEFRQSNTP